MLARGARHRQHVVERHRNVRHDDLPGRLREGLAWNVRIARPERGLGFLCAGPAQFAPHFPANPEQQDAAREQQADDRQQLDCHRRKGQAQHRGRNDADQNGPRPAFRRQAGRGKADDDGVVAGQDQVDRHHLQEGGGEIGREKGKTVHDGPHDIRSVRHRSHGAARGARPDRVTMAARRLPGKKNRLRHIGPNHSGIPAPNLFDRPV